MYKKIDFMAEKHDVVDLFTITLIIVWRNLAGRSITPCIIISITPTVYELNVKTKRKKEK